MPNYNHYAGFNINNVKAITPEEKSSKMIKEWTTDKYKGDNQYGRMENGQLIFPVWKTESELAAMPLEEMQTLLSDPNSKYYKDYTDKLKGTLSAGTSIASLLSFNKGMGLGTESSATIANEQNKANVAKINDYATQATKDLFLSNTSNSINAGNVAVQNAQFNQGINFQKDMYKQQKQDSIMNNLLSLISGGTGTLLGGIGGTGGGTSTNTTISPGSTGYWRMK